MNADAPVMVQGGRPEDTYRCMIACCISTRKPTALVRLLLKVGAAKSVHRKSMGRPSSTLSTLVSTEG